MPTVATRGASAIIRSVAPPRRQPRIPAPALLLALVPALAVASPAVRPAGGAPAPPDEPVRVSTRALGETVTLEVLGLRREPAQAAVRAALARLQEVEVLLASAVEGLNAGADAERTVGVEPGVAALLERSLSYCAWSRGAHGPLGGGLAAHWRATAGNPTPPPVPRALAESAACERLELDREGGTARIAAGSQVDLSGFAAGFAADRAVEALEAAGAANARVRIGRVVRTFGPGPPDAGGRGWPVTLPVFEGFEQPLDELLLRDASLALVWRADWPAGRPIHLDQRTGRPPDTVWAVVAVSELALDAQAVAVSALVLGAREGRFRIANLEPEPSVLWLLGRGRGRPLLVELNWSDLPKP